MRKTNTMNECREVPLVGARFLANRFGVSTRTIYSWTHNGTIPAVVKIGNVLRFDPDAVAEAVAKASSVTHDGVETGSPCQRSIPAKEPVKASEAHRRNGRSSE